MVGAHLAKLGAVHIDADKLAREVVEPGEPALARIAEEFGPTVLAADGSLNRAALGAIVFADADKRRLLQDITHPAVRERAKKRMVDADAADPAAVVVYDIPLLIESGPVSGFDLIVVAMASEETRLQRLIDLRAMTPAEARGRMAAQATDEQRRAVADVLIDTNDSMEETLAQVDAVWARASAEASNSAGGKQRQ